MKKTLKKSVSILLSLIMVFSLFSIVPLSASAATQSSDGNWNWFFNYGYGGITQYTGPVNNGTLIMPHIIDGNDDKPMTIIDTCSFCDGMTCEPYNHINELIVEEGYTELAEYCFMYADINKVVLPSTITTYTRDGYVFAGSTVSELELKGGTSICDGMFAACYNLTRLTVPSTITSVGEDVFWDVDTSKLTIVVEAGSTTEALFKSIAPDATYEEPTPSHTHSWTVSAMTLNADDRQTVTVSLVCPEDGAMSSTLITDYTPIDGTVDEATCLNPGSMKINATFIKDGQSITVGQDSVHVSIPKYDEHDYSVQKWVWKDDTPSELTVYCAHCTKDMYDDPENSHAEIRIESSAAPNNYLITSDDDGWTVGKVNTNHMFFSLGLPTYANYGTVYSDNDYAYYSDTAPVWAWEDDLSAATATFRDSHVENGTITAVTTREPSTTQTGSFTATATVEYNGNVYTSVRTGTTPVIPSYTVTWKNGSQVIETDTYVEEGSTPEYNGETPTQDEDADYTYTFSGWTDGTNTYGLDDTLPAVTADVTYTATFDATAKPAAVTYYIVGTMNEWTVSDAYKLTANPNNDAEYMFTDLTVDANTELKVKDSNGVWYPDGSNFTLNAAGTYDIYFRPDGQGDQSQGWHYGNIFANNYREPEPVDDGFILLPLSADGLEVGDYYFDVDKYQYFYHMSITETEMTEEEWEAFKTEFPEEFAQEKEEIVSIIEGWDLAYNPESRAFRADGYLCTEGGDYDYFIACLKQVEPEPTTYTVTWKNDDGSVIDTTTVAYGETPTHAAPSKDECEFAGWNDGTAIYAAGTALPAVTDDATYTAVFTFTDEVGARLIGHTLSLDGDIGVNFYMELSDDVIANPDAYMHFTIPNGGNTIEQDVPVGSAKVKQMGGKTYYVFKCNVAAKEMNSVIKAQIISGTKEGTEYTYSVKEYADYLLSHTDVDAYADAAPLVISMLNYGARAQLYFEPDTAAEDLVNADRVTDISGVTADSITSHTYTNSLPDTVTFSGATLSLKSETTLSLYFNSDKTLKFECDGKTVETKTSGDYQVARIRGIKAKELKNDFTLTVKEGDTVLGTIDYSPMTYCYNVLSDEDQPENLQNAVKALYLYAEAADDYFD